MLKRENAQLQSADHLDVFLRWVRPCQREALLSNGIVTLPWLSKAGFRT